MSLCKKRPTVRRLFACLIFGIIISLGALLGLHFYYQTIFQRSALKERYFILTGISALVIMLIFIFPVNKPKRFFKAIGRLLLFALSVILVWAGGIFYLIQNEFMFQPMPVDPAQEASLQANPAVEEVILYHDDETQTHGYLWKTAPEKAGLILYFGGNADMAVQRMESLVYSLQGPNTDKFHFMMLDYPGYGKSTGDPSEESIYQMAQAVWAYALSREDIDQDKIVLVGWSLGTGIAVRLAAEENPAGLLLFAPFYNGAELVNSYISKLIPNAPENMLKGSFKRLVRNPFQSDVYASQVQSPVLVIGAKNDQVISFDQAERLEKLFPNGELLIIEGGHSFMWSELNSLSKIAQFLNEIAQ